MLVSRFTVRVILLAIGPIIAVFAALLAIQYVEARNLADSTKTISRDGLGLIYQRYVQARASDIADKVELRLALARNELSVLTAMAQTILDDPELRGIGARAGDTDFLSADMRYDRDNNWSTNGANDTNVSVSVAGYLHDAEGRVDPTATAFLQSMAPLKIALNAFQGHGVDKGWMYLVGPKAAPAAMGAPWANMPELLESVYPGSNMANWWDFFFPGLLESWEAWAIDPTSQPYTLDDQSVVTPLYEDAGGTGLMISLFSPLWDTNRFRIEGAASLDFNITNIIDLVRDEKITDSSFSFVMRGDGDVLSVDPDLAAVLGLSGTLDRQDGGVKQRNVNLAHSALPTVQALTDALANDGTWLGEFTDAHGEAYITAFHEVTGFNAWTGITAPIARESLHVGMVVPKREIFRIQRDIEDSITDITATTSRQTIIVSAIVVLAAALLAVLYAIRATRQVRLLSAAARSVRESNFDVSVPITSGDELGQLARTFNTMILEIQSSYTRLQDFAQSLEQKVQERTQSLEDAKAELERLSRTDGLTGIANRRSLDEFVARKMAEAIRDRRSIAFMMIDVDYFKKYNDLYGHQEGDACLRHIADELKAGLSRATDFLARYGGEEFCVVLDADDQQALATAERLRNRIAVLALPHDGSDMGLVSVSIGVVAFTPKVGETAAPYFAHADKALYDCKRAGRDQVLLHKVARERMP